VNTLQKYEKYLYLILLIGTFVYSPIFFNGFVWDDFTFILNNSQLHQLNIPALFGSSIFNSGPFYRPIPAVYFTFLYTLSGNHALLYHLLQLALHLADTFLLFIFLGLFFTDGIAFFLALIFLVHPINVESVAYIGATQSELYFLPGIIALLLATRKNLTRSKFLWISGLLLLATLTKETGFLFYLLILVYRFLFKLGNLKKFFLLGITIIAIYVVLRIFVGGVVFQEANYIPIAALSLQQRLLNIPAIMFYYIKTFVFPSTLTIWQSWVITKITVPSFTFPLIICLLFFTLIAYFITILAEQTKKSVQTTQALQNQKKHIQERHASLNEFLFFVIWFIIGIGLILQIVPLDMTVADRWFYFPIVGLLGMLGVTLQFFQPAIKKHNIIFLFGAIIIICLLSQRTFLRTFDWRNQLTIYADARHQNYENYMLDNAYADQLFNTGKHSEAIMYEERSIAISPTLIDVSLLGEFYRELNQCDAAIPEYENALTYYKAPTQVHNGLMPQEDLALEVTYINLTDCYMRTGLPQSAIDLITNKALKKFPSNSRLYFILSVAYYQVGDQQQALNAISKAYTLSPDPLVTKVYNQLKNNIPLSP